MSFFFFFKQKTEYEILGDGVQTCALPISRAGPGADHPHDRRREGRAGGAQAVASRARSSRRRILPDGDRGIASTNSTARTFLYAATRWATNAVTSAASRSASGRGKIGRASCRERV